MGGDPSITIFPILHGKAAFAQELRRRCLETTYDCIAIDLPQQFAPYLSSAVDLLPEIHALVAREPSGPLFYLPVDPCDASIEAIRQSESHHTPWHLIGLPVCEQEPPLPPLPDAQALALLGIDSYSSLCLRVIRKNATSPQAMQHGVHLAQRLRELKKQFSSILAVVHLRHCAGLYDALQGQGTSENTRQTPAPVPCSIIVERINPDHLYFALGELPYITGKYELERYNPLSTTFNPLTALKDLFRETRETLTSTTAQIITLSPVRIQAALTFLRNLTVLSGSLLPSLFDIVEAARGVGGNSYALQILKNARYYPWITFEDKTTMLGISIDRMRVPAWATTEHAVNLLRDHTLYWRTISLRPDPTEERRKQYRYTWDPHGMCSHVPEDITIEQFNGRVRNKAQRMLIEDHATAEKFHTSVKDGIDIRETVRHWHTGDLYVKELPPARGSVDTVIIIFDAENDHHYSNATTWYAEHPDESTLTFYATDPFTDLIGPGIARCTYGGLSLMFPPRPIPDIFRMSTTPALPDRRSQLTLGALLFSREKHIAYVATQRPSPLLTRLADRYNKRLLYIPLSTFSHETITRLRTFHILNGKQVRSWATRFIGDLP